MTMVTHVVHYDYWYRDRNGDSDLRSNSINCFNEEGAKIDAEFYRNHKDVVAKSVVIEKLDKPFMAGSEYED
jgi:hypothetical protein